MSIAPSPFDIWRTEYAFVRLLADERERLELEQSAQADARQRLMSANPVLARQVWRAQ